MEKGTPLREEASTLGSESDEKERIVGSEKLSTSSRELNDISDIPVLNTVDTSTSRYPIDDEYKAANGRLIAAKG